LRQSFRRFGAVVEDMDFGSLTEKAHEIRQTRGIASTNICVRDVMSTPPHALANARNVQFRRAQPHIHNDHVTAGLKRGVQELRKSAPAQRRLKREILFPRDRAPKSIDTGLPGMGVRFRDIPPLVDQAACEQIGIKVGCTLPGQEFPDEAALARTVCTRGNDNTAFTPSHDL
jgi:hypothetical protein